LIDTAPLVALCDPRDGLHQRALKDLGRVSRQPLVVCDPVLTEACFLLPHPIQRQRLHRLLAELPIQPVRVEPERLWNDVFTWLQKYAEHQPDWADGYLLALTRAVGGAQIWTYDKEYSTTWRTLDGRRPKLLVDPRR
jgi:predicted nucleic acid-binding protein